jgi:hypothetical protein
MLQCCGLDLTILDAFELVCPDEYHEDRCPNPATCRFYTELEWVPLCAEHYDLWMQKVESDGTPYLPAR